MNFTIGFCGVLGHILGPPVANAEIEVALFIEYNAVPVVVPGIAVSLPGSFINYFFIHPLHSPDTAPDNAGHGQGPAFSLRGFNGMAVRKIDPSILPVSRIGIYIHQTSLALIYHPGSALHGFIQNLSFDDYPQHSGFFGDQSSIPVQEGDGPGNIQFIDPYFGINCIMNAFQGGRWIRFHYPCL